MSVLFGTVQFAVYTRLSTRLRATSKENKEHIFSSLEQLTELLANAPAPWYVVGGVGIDLHTGDFQRFHHDIDIEIPTEHKKDFIQYMNEQHYGLFKKLFSTNIPSNKRLVAYQETSIDDCLPETTNRIRLVKMNENVIVDGLLTPLSYLDLSFTRTTKQGTQIGYHGKTFVLTEEYSPDHMRFPINESTLRLRNPVYAQVLKQDFNRTIDEFDKQTLLTLLE